MRDLMKLYDFAVIVIAVLATIGGTAYLMYDKHYLFGVVNLFVVAMAMPYIIKRAKDLLQ